MRVQLFNVLPFLLLAFVAFGVVVVIQKEKPQTDGPAKAERDQIEVQIEEALFTRTEFFGAQAIVPYPTAEARTRLAQLSQEHPNEPRIFLNLVRINEKLGHYAKAEEALRRYVELKSNSADALNELADYQHRRAQFEQEAETLEKLLNVESAGNRAPVMVRLLDLARLHKLEKYLGPGPYEKAIAKDANAFGLIQQYVDKLIEQGNYADALKIITQHKPRFPEHADYFVEQETQTLGQMGKEKEAETAYHAAFNPFWTSEQSDKYYQFLSSRDRLRAYGAELKEKFRRNSSDYDVAIRLYHYLTNSYFSEDRPEIFARLERERSKRKIEWKSDELATASRLLIAAGDGNSASRFLYTLYTKGELKEGSELRAKILYQLFELLIDAHDERLAITRGDLQFYADVAKSDTHPGMVGGVLSLIFSDAEPQKELAQMENASVALFNRAAAFRIFEAYKKEYPTSPELAQMYLDIVRQYAKNKDVDTASKTLAEFESRYAEAPQFPEVALKLADAYSTLGRREEERAVYQKILDHLGRNKKEGSHLVPTASDLSVTYTEPTSIGPSVMPYPFTSNMGITSNNPKTNDDGYYHGTLGSYRDFLGHGPNGENVNYSTALDRLVGSLDQEKRTQDILALYASEVKKYPDEQGLYERWLQWLGQANLVDEQFRVYQEALKRFPTTGWNDRMARWFLRRERNAEFEKFSREILSKMNDAEIAAYLNEFVGNSSSEKPGSFKGQLYLGLYNMAHERFPRNQTFARGLLNYYSAHGDWASWRKLMAEYYFESEQVRAEFLRHLSEKKELRAHLDKARSLGQANDSSNTIAALPYKLFRADASVWLANFEEAIDVYRDLNCLYPNTPEFADRLISFTRSLGQRDRKLLEESAAVQQILADANPTSAIYRTRSGEIQAELGDYDKARSEWEKLFALGKGDTKTYLDTATLYWDYYQYDDALNTIKTLRQQLKDDALYAFQAGAIYEAKHQTSEALMEYAKALDEDTEDYYRAQRRLKTLWRREGVPAQFQKAFERARRIKSIGGDLIIGYAWLMNEVEEWSKASALLRHEVARSKNERFLERASDLFDEAEDAEGEALCLRRLVQLETTPRRQIWYRLRIVNALEQNDERERAAQAMRELLRHFPTNYGVLNEAAKFFKRSGFNEEGLRVLARAAQRGKGKYRYQFAKQLAARQLELNRIAAAQKTLEWLHKENKLDSGVFQELARVYVRTNNQTALRRTYNETLTEIKEQDIDLADKRRQIATLREEMIDAFTRLKDYTSAVDQHIEIINRNPEDEERVDAAIDYTKRYGGADRLLAYYQKTAQQAYKNYRWNLVLARLYEANNELEKAAQEYRTAIGNQPEELELYDALAGVYQRSKNYNAAIEVLRKALELSNDEPYYVRRAVDVLKQAGRHQEANALKQKLPQEAAKPEQTLADKFREAESLKWSEKEKAIEAYKQAINEILADPLKHELKASEITGFVQTVRDGHGLHNVVQTLWTLRAKLLKECESGGGAKARAQLQILDGAMSEAVGQLAADKATGEELSALYADLNARIENTQVQQDQYGTLSLLLSITHRAGFGALEEKVLIARKDAAFSKSDYAIYHSNLRLLVGFYSQRGKYNRVIELLENEIKRDPKADEFEYWKTIAENARLVGDAARELEALRQNYQRSVSKKQTTSDPLIERYFTALLERGDEGRNEIRSLIQQPSSLHQSLISFLLSKKESALVHEAIEKASMSLGWKLARQSEASLSLKEFDAANENFFLQALQYKTIGELIVQKPNQEQQVIGNDWFRLANLYGEWLYAVNNTTKEKSRLMLPAMVENRPQDADEQAKLGRWYLDQRDAKRAAEHLEIALEMNPDDKRFVADLGTAYFILKDRKRAFELWSRLIASEDDNPTADNCKLYLETLTKNGLAQEARENLKAEMLRRFENSGTSPYDNQYDNEPVERLKTLIRALSVSFDKRDERNEPRKLKPEEETEKAQFFFSLYQSKPSASLLFETLTREKLIAREQYAQFYRVLIKGSSMDLYSSDYEFQSLTNSFMSADERDALYDHQKDYKIEESSSDLVNYQRELLELLFEARQHNEARKLITDIEAELKGRYARPVWLRLAKARLLLRERKAAQAMTVLRHVVGIETHKSVTSILSPNIERLNEAVAMLKNEGFHNEALQLQEAAYARSIALDQYDASSFVGLANVAFERGDAKAGLTLLQMMIRLSDEETSAATSAEVASLPLIKAYEIADATIERPEASKNIEIKNALSLAAETAAKWQAVESAIEFRKQLQFISPEDPKNRLELARLLSANGKIDEAITMLASVLGDRNAARSARWQGVWLSQEVIGEKKENWTTLQERVKALNANESELLAALNALALLANGKTDEALKLIETNVNLNPNPEIQFFRALLLKRSGQAAAALEAFNSTLQSERDSQIVSAFGFAEESALRQAVRLYLSLNQPRAALKLAEQDRELKAEIEKQTKEKREEKYLTLDLRASELKERLRVELATTLKETEEKLKNGS